MQSIEMRLLLTGEGLGQFGDLFSSINSTSAMIRPRVRVSVCDLRAETSGCVWEVNKKFASIGI